MTDSVRIIVDDDEDDDEDNDDLSVVCLGYPASVNTATPVSWVANPTGGNGRYTYTWSGMDDLSSSNQYVSRTYSTTGTKSANVQVTSGNLTARNSCNVTVTATSTTQNNYFGITNGTETGSKKVLNLDGRRGDYVAVNNSSSLTINNQITLEAWVKPSGWVRANNEAEGVSTIVAKGQIAESWDYWFGLDNGKIYYTSGSRGTPVRTCNPVVPLNVWSHVAVSINGSSISMYLNGNKVDSLCGGVSSVGISQSSKNLYIGNIYPKYCSASWFNFGFKGQMDDVRIWNTARTAAEILSSTSTLVTSVGNSVPAARWTFDSGSPVDVTGNNNHGSMVGINAGVVSGAPTIVADPGSPASLFVGNAFSIYTQVNDNACEVATTDIKTPGPVTYVEISGVVTGKAKCVNQDGGSSQYTGITISPCSGAPVVSRVYNLDPSGAPSSSGNNQSGITQGYSSPILALWVARYGAEPQVGDSIIGTLQSPKTEVGTFCWTGKPGTETGNFISGSEGAQIGGWLTTGGYGLSANSCSTTASSCGSGGGLLSMLGPLLFGPAFNSSSCDGSSSNDSNPIIQINTQIASTTMSIIGGGNSSGNSSISW